MLFLGSYVSYNNNTLTGYALGQQWNTIVANSSFYLVQLLIKDSFMMIILDPKTQLPWK